MELILVSEQWPTEEGKRYLCQRNFGKNSRFEICNFSNDLYQFHKYYFSDYKRKKQKGFYYYNDEWGYIHASNVVAWCELPEPIKENKKK